MENKQRVSKKKDFSEVSVLIFGAGGRQALPMCRGFYKLGCKVTVYCSSKSATGSLTRFKHDKVIYNEKNRYNEDFMEYGMRVIKKGKYDLVVPLGDQTAMFLSQHKEELKDFAKIAVNDWDVFSKVIDKTKTMQVCEENNIPAPRTLFTDDPVSEIRRKGLSYPVVVKPKTGVGSIGFNIVKDEATLKKLLDNYDNQNGPLLVQEYIEQEGASQYGAEIFRDRDGVIRAALVAEVARWYPIDGGSRLLSISIHDQDIVDSCVDLVNALNWNGYANIDLVWDAKEKKAKILELNGRTGASVKLDFLAGVDIARLIVENELGYPVSDMLEYEDGKQISCFMVDCLWFLKAKNRWSTKPSWFARWKIKDVVWAWDDPLPSLGFVVTSLKSYGDAKNKRKRFDA